ncbi:hypothetical protein SprV_0501969300 [Sparganum proliferum]
MNLLIAILISFHSAECCLFINKIPKCPRNDEDIILDEVAEYLACKAYPLSFEKTIFLKDNWRLNLEVQINRTSLHFDCTFSRDVEPAKYLQYTCRSHILELKVHIEEERRSSCMYYKTWNTVRYVIFDLLGLTLTATLDITYWRKDFGSPNKIRLSPVGLCGSHTNTTICVLLTSTHY